MKYLIENWYLIVAYVAIAVACVIAVVRFIKLPKSERYRKVKKWLLQAVIAAEAEFGSGTGKLKLSTVYASFIKAFPWLSKLMSFDKFSGLVDDVLEEMRLLFEENKAIKEIVK